MKQQSQSLLHKLGGYYLIPHELLHVLAYRLIHKPCQYHWGDYQVISSAPKTRSERLFVLLFPVTICWVLGLSFHSIWVILALSAQLPPEQYFLEAPLWHFAFPIIASIFILYSGTAYKDVRRALQILSGSEQSQQDSDKPRIQTKQE